MAHPLEEDPDPPRRRIPPRRNSTPKVVFDGTDDLHLRRRAPPERSLRDQDSPGRQGRPGHVGRRPTSGQDEVDGIDISDLEPGLYTVTVTPAGSDAGRGAAPDPIGPRPFRLHTRVTGDEEPSTPPTAVTLTPRKAAASASNALWEEIRIWSERRRFENYELYIRDQICPTDAALDRSGLAGASMDDIVKHTREFLAGKLNGEQLENVPVIDANRKAVYVGETTSSCPT